MSSKLMAYFNQQPRIGTLSTSGSDGKVNSAYFGSPYMIDEKTIVMGLTRNRTLSYLQENPNAVFMIMEPGRALSEWKGLRIYVRMTGIATAREDQGSDRRRRRRGGRPDDPRGFGFRGAGGPAAGGLRARVGAVDLTPSITDCP